MTGRTARLYVVELQEVEIRHSPGPWKCQPSPLGYQVVAMPTPIKVNGGPYLRGNTVMPYLLGDAGRRGFLKHLYEDVARLIAHVRSAQETT